MWNQSIPWWFKKGVSESIKAVPEITKNIPKDDWSKPKEEAKPDDKKTTDSTKPDDKLESSKSLFSGEIKVGKLRSKYDLNIQQDKQSESTGKEDMGGK
jgi:hypothetical protein